MDLPLWIEETLATQLRARLERLVAARGGTPTTVDQAIDEIKDRLLTREWTGALKRAVAGDDDDETRRVVDALAFSVCRRRVADELRKNWRRQGLVRAHENELAEQAYGAKTPTDYLEAREYLRAVLVAMDRLSNSDRELISDAVDGALDDAMSSATRSRLHRARARLLRALNEIRKTGEEGNR